jgi:D-alanyl-D-alanine carboxypeptidase
VVLGASSGQARAVKAAQLLERGFSNSTLSWLRPSLGTVENLVPVDASPPNLRDEMCSGKRHKPASDEDEDTIASNGSSSGEGGLTFFAAGMQPPMPKPSELIAAAPAPSEPIPVYTGPTRTGAALIAAVAADSEKQTSRHRGKKTQVAAKKPDGAAESRADAKSDKKSDKKAETKPAAKPAATKRASVKPSAGAKAAEKSAASMEKPAKPKAVAKPSTRAKSTSSDASPLDQKTAAPHS